MTTQPKPPKENYHPSNQRFFFRQLQPGDKRLYPNEDYNAVKSAAYGFTRRTGIILIALREKDGVTVLNKTPKDLLTPNTLTR